MVTSATIVIPYEQDLGFDHHSNPTEEAVVELKQRARKAFVLSPHILPDDSHTS